MALRTLISDEIKLLTFRPFTPNRDVHWGGYLAFGLFFAWLAGMGRYWDNPRAAIWQHLGLGSVAYVFCFSLLLWLILAPLRPERWRYRNVLVFVALTSPPALLYAVPVERFMALGAAQAVNAWFLAVVAAWRIALLVLFLRRSAGLGGFTIMVAACLPLVLIVNVLTALNLEHVVFDFMSGVRESRAITQRHRLRGALRDHDAVDNARPRASGILRLAGLPCEKAP